MRSEYFHAVGTLAPASIKLSRSRDDFNVKGLLPPKLKMMPLNVLPSAFFSPLRDRILSWAEK